MVTIKQRNKRNQLEPDDPAPSEKHARQRAAEILRASGRLPRDLDDWLHTERDPETSRNPSRMEPTLNTISLYLCRFQKK